MQVPVQITFRDNLPHSPAVEEHIKEKADKLQQYSDQLVSCHVVIELSSKHQNHGNHFNTRLTATVPHKELVSTRNDDENMYTSINIAFEDLKRQLEEYNRKLHGKVKHHSPVLSGTVSRLINGDDMGFIEAPDGTEYYFNPSHITTGSFDDIKIGTSVSFIEFTGHEGLQAHRIKVLSEG